MGYSSREKSPGKLVHNLLPSQKTSISTSRKSSRGGKRSAWRSKELLIELIYKKEVYKRWNEGQMTLFAERDLGVLVSKKLIMSQPCTLTAKAAKSLLICINKSIASMLRKVILLLFSSEEAKHALLCLILSFALEERY